ncbi:MAG: hypothetical protein ACK56I_10925, partial [bacterium]
IISLGQDPDIQAKQEKRDGLKPKWLLQKLVPQFLPIDCLIKLKLILLEERFLLFLLPSLLLLHLKQQLLELSKVRLVGLRCITLDE